MSGPTLITVCALAGALLVILAIAALAVYDARRREEQQR